MKPSKARIRTKQWLYSLEPPVVAAVCLLAALVSDLTVFAWLTPLFIFVALPIMDRRSPHDKMDPDRVIEQLKAKRGYYQAIVRAYVPLQWLVTALALACFATTQEGIWMTVGLVLSAGIVNGIAIAPAHELNHQRGAINRLFALLGVTLTFYGQFLVEHNRGHHVRVATPQDPASARLGESFWEFALRSVFMGLVSACRFELSDWRRSPKLTTVLNSKLLQAWLVSAVVFGSVLLWLGLGLFLFLVAQAVAGVLLLEVVNYIEHYGLKRELIDGRYEPCTPAHSWSSNKLVTNIGLYNLQRHADHHANPTKPYEQLKHYKDSPQHPTGYAAMIVLALVPSLWFRTMDPRVLAMYGGDPAKANVQPRKLKKYMKTA